MDFQLARLLAMSPSQAQQHHATRTGMINVGSRPPAFKVSKASHLIHKSCSSSSSSETPLVTVSTTNHKEPLQHHQVVIYTHSQKIIHTNASDFMALVQKHTELTSKSEEHSLQVKDGQLSKMQVKGSPKKINTKVMV